MRRKSISNTNETELEFDFGCHEFKQKSKVCVQRVSLNLQKWDSFKPVLIFHLLPANFFRNSRKFWHLFWVHHELYFKHDDIAQTDFVDKLVKAVALTEGESIFRERMKIRLTFYKRVPVSL